MAKLLLNTTEDRFYKQIFLTIISLFFFIFIQAQTSDVTIDVTWPNWSSENRVRLYNPSGTLITVLDNGYSGGSNNNFSTTYNVGCLPNGNNYYVVLYDSNNDGWDGSDNITVTSGGSTVINQNGNAATSGGLTVYFNVPGGGSACSAVTAGPGGVTSDLELWLKSDAGLSYSDGQSVSLWSDQGNGADARVTRSGLEPTYRDNPTYNVNFNPVVDFNNDYNDVQQTYDYTTNSNKNSMFGGTGLYTQDIFMVVIPDVTVNSSLASMDMFCGDVNLGSRQRDGTGIGFGRYSIRFVDEILTYAVGTSPDPNPSDVNIRGYGVAHTGTTATYDNVGIINSKNNSNSPTANILYYNANNVGNTEVGLPQYANVNDSRYWLGRSEAFNGSYEGRICEVITYSAKKTDANLTQERNRIQSYLAIKYGITLGTNGASQDYVDSSGSLIWDVNTGVAANDVFNYDIAGIGRDDAAELNQKQSKSVNATVTDEDITIGLTDIAATNSANVNTFANDKNFLVWGNDNGALTAKPTVTVNMSIDIAPALTTDVDFTPSNRTWKVREKGSVGTTKISVPLSILTPLGVPPGDYLMFISPTPTFAPTAEYRVLTLNGSNYETTYDFNGTNYITFGFAPEKTFVRSIYFDGIDDYLDAGDVLDLTGAFTLSTWIKRDVGVTGKDIISKRNIPLTEGYVVYINSTGNIVMTWQDAGGSTRSITSNISIPENEWHHIAVTHDGATARIYIDGVLSSTNVIPPPAASTQNFLIGASRPSSPTRLFKGNIDEVRVWNTALTVSQLHYLMNQEIEKNGLNVAGSYFNKGLILPGLPAGTAVIPSKNDILPWANLQAYYPMSRYTFTNAKDESNNNYTAALKNLTTVDRQTAPLPYVSTNNGAWSTNATWLNGNVQTIPGATSIVDNTKTVDWNIVETNHNLTMDNSSLPTSTLGVNNRSLLALNVKGDKIVVNGNNTTGTGNGLTVTHYLKLDGVIDLEGESQLIQTDQSDLAVNSTGHIEKDQQGTANSYTYNYWSSPVSAIGIGTNNTPYKIIDVLKDGTTPSTPVTPTFEAGTTQTSVSPFYADGALTAPRKIAKYWFWKFVNNGNAYANWVWAGNANMNVTEGYTMKGVSGASAITDNQNYTFIGKPNNVPNGTSQMIHTTFAVPAPNPDISLTGNPFPSAMDADEFIRDNKATTGTGAIDGSIYFWEHWGGGTHNLQDYQGGYAIRNLTTGVAATSHPTVNQTGSGVKGAPGQFIPPGQGFFVISSATGGDVVFKNTQRVFQKESAGVSVFYRGTIAESTTSGTDIEGDKMIVRLGFKSPSGYHRQIAVGFNVQGATDGFDVGYDATNGDILSNDAFFTLDDKYLVIQGFDDFKVEREIPLVIIIDGDNDQGLETFMIDGLENVPNDVEIYIKDNLTGETYDIKDQNFEINLPTGEHKDRFSLVFQPRLLSVDEIATIEEGFHIYMNNSLSEITIQKIVDVDLTKVTMVNTLGQVLNVWSEGLENRQTNLPVNVSSGVYIITVETNEGTITKKLLIK